MNKQKAFELIKAFFKSKKITVADLDERNNYFQIQVETEIISFNYRADDETLTVSCLIYQFHNQPRQGVLAAIKGEAKNESLAEIKFESENKTLYAAKTYSDQIDDERFISEVDKIIATGKKWSGKTLDHIASKVFHPEEVN